jgi:hypothetical protein
VKTVFGTLGVRFGNASRNLGAVSGIVSPAVAAAVFATPPILAVQSAVVEEDCQLLRGKRQSGGNSIVDPRNIRFAFGGGDRS